MKHIFVLMSVVCLILFSSCMANDQGDDQQQTEKPKPAKENAIEYIAQTSQLPDGRVIVQTKQTIYVAKNIMKINTTVDTLPSLGTEKIQVDDETSDNQKDTVVQKQYDVLFSMQ